MKRNKPDRQRRLLLIATSTIGAVGLGENWPGGYFCPCHDSMFDFAGRVYKNVPAPTNLVVPPYTFLSDTSLLIGEHLQIGTPDRAGVGTTIG